MMTRHPDWQLRLAAVLDEWRTVSFRWGERDCAQFALACLAAVSDRDWKEVAPERYASRRAARRVLRQLGVDDVAALADALLGPRCAAEFLRRGDLAALSSPDGPALGVCVDARIAAMGPDGLVFRPRRDVLAGWRV